MIRPAGKFIHDVYNLKKGLKSASWLTIGNLCSQAITFLWLIYIARVLGTEQYGVYETVVTFVAFFQLFLILGLDKSVLREASKAPAQMADCFARTLGLRFLLIAFAVLICLIACFFVSYELQIKIYIAFFSLRLAAVGVSNVFQALFQAVEKMHFIAILSVLNRLAVIFLSFSIFSAGLGLVYLLLVLLFADALTAILYYWSADKYLHIRLVPARHVDRLVIKGAVLFSLISLVRLFSNEIDLLMISLLSSSRDVGIYGVAFRLARQGLVLYNLTLIAFLPMLVRRMQAGPIQVSMLLKYSLFFSLAILFVSVAAALFCVNIITFLFGNQYYEAGVILKVLIFFLTAWWLTLPFSAIAQATHNEKYIFIAMTVMAVLNLPLNFVFFYNFGLIGIAYSKLVIYGVGSILMCILIFRVLLKQKKLAFASKNQPRHTRRI